MVRQSHISLCCSTFFLNQTKIKDFFVFERRIGGPSIARLSMFTKLVDRWQDQYYLIWISPFFKMKILSRDFFIKG